MNEQYVKRPSRSRVRLLKLLNRPSSQHLIDFHYLAREHASDFGELLDLNHRDVIRRYLDTVSRDPIDPNSTFSELGYLAHNADVARAVRRGEFHCGFHHWLEVGLAAQRPGGLKKTLPTDQESGAVLESRGPYFTPLQNFPISDPMNIDPDVAVSVLRHSGVVDLTRYQTLYPDLANAGVDPLWHYVHAGYRDKRKIHPFFDDGYYLSVAPVLPPGCIPLLHYLFSGAAIGLNPNPLISTFDYCTRFDLDLTITNPLIHLAMSENDELLVDRPLFDRGYYESRHPESRDFPGGSFHHFLVFGVFTGCNPSPDFNTKFYCATHLGGDYSLHAYFHHITTGRAQGLETFVPPSVPTLARDVRHFSAPGPEFEELDRDIAAGKGRRGKIISFYLPQFHAFPENDEWWGRGFTEWRNLPRGIPRFSGHYQPRVPRDLSFYDLTDLNVMRRQVDLARAMGVWGFAFYFYWFNRHRLMETPLDAFLADPSIDMPFMLIWANENWTRRWDGAEHELLIKQDHDLEDDAALVDCFARYFEDPRYIRLNGKPFLVIYRADIIPDTEATIARWKRLFLSRHGLEPIIYLAQTFGAENPDDYGFDGAIEFPPHKIGRTLPEINTGLTFYDWDFEGSVCRYSDAVSLSLGEAPPSFPLVKTVFPSWDNNARRQTSGMVFHGATPKLFGEWLDGALDYAEKNPVEGEALVFVNAWNEWCEGAYLEPDVHFGGAMLNTLASVVATPKRNLSDKYKVLLIGHDAFPAGAQRNLLAFAKVLRNRFGVDVEVVLLGDGALLESYKQAAPTTVCDWADLSRHLQDLHSRGFRHALLNTVVTGAATRLAKDIGFNVVSLVHELPQLIEEYGLKNHAQELSLCADHVVFPADFVREAFLGHVGSIAGNVVTLPQGIYHKFDRDRDAGRAVRSALEIPENSVVALNVGYGDLRKGIDIFCQVGHLCFDRGIDMHFVWVGDVHPSLRLWLIEDLSHRGIRNVHFIGETKDVAGYMNAADVLFLTSREDPFPSVVMEALQVGLPIVAFEKNGGFTNLLSRDPRLGVLVPQADTGIIVTELMSAARSSHDPELVSHRIALVRDEFNFDEYCFKVLNLFDPDLEKVSVVVPNYNYARYLPARLASIFDQSYPIYEIIVLDDCSKDESVAELTRIAQSTGRVFRVETSSQNTGSAFGQWQSALNLARGEYLWIAEADDLSESRFVEQLIDQAIAVGDTRFVFSDSRSIDDAGYKVYDSYIPYADSVTPGALRKTASFSTRQFTTQALSVANLVLNISGVIWRSDALRQAFASATSDISTLRIAGDWRLYLAACEKGEGSVGYVAEPLNIHRRHQKSVTGRMDVEAHLNEIRTMHKKASKLVGRNDRISRRQRTYLADAEKWLEG